MKHIRILLLFLCLTASSFAQQAITDFPLSDREGKVYSSKEIIEKNNPKVIVFWSQYCGKCKIEMKGIRNVGKNWYSDYGAEVYFVSLENYPGDSYANNTELISELERDGVYFLHDNQIQFFNSYSKSFIPLTAMYDSNGQIVHLWRTYDYGLESSIGMSFKKLHARKNETVNQ